jgi:hypothetical protein
MFDLTCERNRFPVVAKNHRGEDVNFDLYYRRPTTEELVAYNAKLIQHKNGKLVSNVVPTRIEYGLKILVGFQDGIFQANGKAISSDPASLDFFPDWKQLLRNVLSTTVAKFAFDVYEATKEAQATAEDTETEVEGELPLGSR